MSAATRRELKRFHKRLGQLRFLDPACGCGNFLVVTYRELRLLEIEVLQELFDNGQRVLDIQHVSVVDVDAMYGIEIDEWPVRIAEVAMWLMDHQMNLRLSASVRPVLRPPAAAEVAPDRPRQRPAAGLEGIAAARPVQLRPGQSAVRRREVPDRRTTGRHGPGRGPRPQQRVAGLRHGLVLQGRGLHSRTRAIVVGFVSTNSITQGEQVGVLWGELFRNYGVTIHFGHRTFAWESEARGKAHVHVVIIGFAAFDATGKKLFDYESAETVSETKVRNISPYLIEGSNQVVANRQTPLCDVPEIGIGNKPIDDGNYLFTPGEKDAFLDVRTRSGAALPPLVRLPGVHQRHRRWCLWLGDCPPHVLRRLPEAREAGRRRPPLPRGQQERADPKAGGDADSVPRREHARRAVPGDPQGFVRTAQVHSHRLHAARRAGQRSVFPDARCDTISLRRPVVRHAHGLGAAGVRAA